MSISADGSAPCRAACSWRATMSPTSAESSVPAALRRNVGNGAIDHNAVELDQPQRAVAAHRIEAGDVKAPLVEIADDVHVLRHALVDADHRGLRLQGADRRQAVARTAQHLDIEPLGVDLE